MSPSSLAVCLLATFCATCFSLPLTPDATRILGGAPVFDIKFHAGMRIVRGDGIVTGCPGTVLRRRWVITAAHCFRAATTTPEVTVSEFRVWVPLLVRKDFIEPSAEKTYLVDAMYIHKDRDNTPGGNGHNHDLALVKLSRPIPRADFQRVKLPRRRKHMAQPDETLYVAQFRHGSNNSLDLPLNIAPFTHKTDAQLRAMGRGAVDETMICAVSTGFPEEANTAICGGDSGSGILRRMPGGAYMHMGVTSLSIPMAANTPCNSPGDRFYFASTYYHADDIRALFRGDESAWVKTV